MKAVTREKYGPPELINIKDVPIPEPGSGEILVRVHFTTVNRTDCGVLWGLPWVIRLFTGLTKPRNKTPGTDFSGVVEAVSADVTTFKTGDRIFGFDDSGDLQSQAQYFTIPVKKPLGRIPDEISFETAAASAEGAHYAFNFMNKLDVQAGKKVLVNGGTGAIGSAAIQLLKYFGCEVTAVCAGDYLDNVLAIGADRVINFEKEDFTQDEQTYDFVFDAVGKSRFKNCKPILKEGGIYLSSELGPRWENIYLALKSKYLGGSKKVVFPVPNDVTGSMKIMTQLLKEGKFQPLIDRTYAMDEIREAYAYVRSGQKNGNVLISYLN